MACSAETKENLVFVKDAASEICPHALVGGKARNLWLLGKLVSCRVPPWFAVTTDSFTYFVEVRKTQEEWIILLLVCPKSYFMK